MRLLICYLVVTVVLNVVNGDDEDASDELLKGSAREAREFLSEGWKAVEVIPESSSGWIPHELAADQSIQHPVKRRRLKKRRKRPPYSAESEPGDMTKPKRKMEPPPTSLDQIQQHWEEMNDDTVVKPNVRRRMPPSYQSSEEIFVDNNAPVRGADYGQRKVTPKEKASLADIKSLLKKSQGSISLSEILQQKNLSLAEVLSGDQKAISVLTEKPIAVTEPVTPTKVAEVDQTTKYKRLPPSVSLKKNPNKNVEHEGNETISTRVMQEAQKRRLSLLHGHKDNRIFPTVTKMDVVTEAITERRIFVPSHPKLYTSLNFKPDFDTYFEYSTKSITTTNEIQTTTPSTTTETAVTKVTTGRMHLRPRVKGPLPVTNAKLKLTTKISFKPHKDGEKHPIPFDIPKPIKINVTEVLGFKQHTEKIEKKVDEPFRIPIDLDIFVQKTVSTSTTDASMSKLKNTISSTATAQKDLSTETSAEKLPQITAKDEISEVLRDEQDRQRLSKILERRNMTLEQLVEQRERGSSQLHLADIFHNKIREPTPAGEPYIGRIITDLVQGYPVFVSSPKVSEATPVRLRIPDNGPENIKETSELIRESEPTAFPVFNKPNDNIPTNASNKPKTTNSLFPNSLKELSPILPQEVRFATFTRKQKSFSSEFSTQPTTMRTSTAIPIVVIKESAPNFPTVNIDTQQPVNSLSWQKVYPELFPEFYNNKEAQEDAFVSAANPFNEEELQRLEETDNSAAFSSREHFTVHRFEDQNFINVPSGVKSVLIVSFSIIGLSILVFLTILIVFRWLQKQRRRLNYCSSLSSRLRSPIIIQGSPTAAIKTFMNETLGRRKHYYKSNVQCMADDMWDCERERKPSFHEHF